MSCPTAGLYEGSHGSLCIGSFALVVLPFLIIVVGVSLIRSSAGVFVPLQSWWLYV